jgi:hypothetical protein
MNTPADLGPTMKLTKTEEAVLAKVRDANSRGALLGLGTSPTAANYSTKEKRFVKRLADAGILVWVWTREHGAGWALSDSADRFRSGEG